MMEVHKALLNRKEAAHALSIGLSTLDILIKSGKLESVRIGKKSVRVSPAQIDAYVRKLSKAA